MSKQMDQTEMMMQMMQQMMLQNQQNQAMMAAMQARLDAAEAKASVASSASVSSASALPMPSSDALSTSSKKEAKEKKPQTPAAAYATQKQSALHTYMKMELLLRGWEAFYSKQSTGSKAKGTKDTFLVERVPVWTTLSNGVRICTHRELTRVEQEKLEAVDHTQDADDFKCEFALVANECGLWMPHGWLMSYQTIFRELYPKEVEEYLEEYDKKNQPPPSSSKRASPASSKPLQKISAEEMKRLREQAKKSSPASSAKSEESVIESIRRSYQKQAAPKAMVAAPIGASSIPKASPAASSKSASSSASSSASELERVDRFVVPKTTSELKTFGTWRGYEVKAYQTTELGPETLVLAIFQHGEDHPMVPIGSAKKVKGKWTGTIEDDEEIQAIRPKGEEAEEADEEDEDEEDEE